MNHTEGRLHAERDVNKPNTWFIGVAGYGYVAEIHREDGLTPQDEADAARVVECWNACARLADPVKAIAAARVAIREASAELLAELENDPEASLLRSALNALNTAAVLFGMEPETLPRDPEADCCVSGYHHPTSIDGDTSRQWITRCDTCEIFESDEEAAKYAANALGMKAVEHDNPNKDFHTKVWSLEEI